MAESVSSARKVEETEKAEGGVVADSEANSLNGSIVDHEKSAENGGSTDSSARNNADGGNQLSRSRTSLSRTESVKATASTAISGLRLRGPRPPFTHPHLHDKTSDDMIVDFEGPDDPYRPLNWPFRKKALTTMLYGFTTMSVTFSSSVYGSGIPQVMREFHVSSEVATLGTAVLLWGWAVGPLLWAPLSERYGRRLAVLTPCFIGALFAFGSGAGDNLQTILICRFFTGFFGAAPLTNTGGVMGDIWAPHQRGTAMVAYVLALVGGPLGGPIVGGALCDAYPRLGWRWTQYITGIFQLVMVTLDTLFCDESYSPTLLTSKARQLRFESGNWALHAKHEEWNVSITELANKYLVRPFQLLATPICAFVALYSAFCYGLLFASLGAFPVVFQEIRGWNELIGSLPFLALLVGVWLGVATNLFNQKFYIRAWKANNNRPVPEARLPPMMLGSLLLPTGLFIFAWTSQKSVPWIVPIIGLTLEGWGFLTIFQATLNYLIDTFQKYSASAVAANTFLRSIFGGAFPMFIVPLLHATGVGWGMSIFAFIGVAMIPIPYLFYIFGKRIRARGFWSRDSVYPE